MSGLDLAGIVIVVAGAALALAGVFMSPAKQLFAKAPRPRRALADAVPAPAQPEASAVAHATAPAPVANGDYREQEALFARTLVTAQKTAEDLVRNAQAEAEQILAKARRDADLIVRTTDQQAAAWLGQLRAESDRLVADAHQAFLAAQRSVEQSVAAFDTSRPAFRVPDWGADPFATAGQSGTFDASAGAVPATEWRPTRIA